MWFGLILWGILIIIIAESACPALIWVILGTMVVYGIIYLGVVWFVDWIKTRKNSTICKFETVNMNIKSIQPASHKVKPENMVDMPCFFHSQM